MVENKCVWGWQFILYPVGRQRVGTTVRMEITERSFVLIKVDSTDGFSHSFCNLLSLFKFHDFIPDYHQIVSLNDLHIVLILRLVFYLKYKRTKTCKLNPKICDDGVLLKQQTSFTLSIVLV